MNAVIRNMSILAVGALVLTGCGADDSSKNSPSPRASEPAHATAYRAGYATGKSVYDSGGKGAAVRETVWGGCTRRALDAGASAESDRGAWVQGCLDGVAARPQHLPTATVTKREENAELLKSFRTWASRNGAQDEAKHTSRLVTVQLTENDFDIELSTDYKGKSQQQPESLAQYFVKWWDGDSGADGTARNILILEAAGRRIVAKRI